MKNKFKPKDIDKELLLFGAYFKSENDITTDYLIELCETIHDNNILVKIYTTTMLENHFDTNGLTNGCIIELPKYETELIVEIELFGKYYFPIIKNDMQLYYDDEKYYSGEHKTNSITSLMECINYAIEYGLKKGEITPC